MDTSRFLTNDELRISLVHKDKQISKLKEELAASQKENNTLRIWNENWQKFIWDKEMVSRFHGVHTEIVGLNYVQNLLLKHVCTLHTNSSRHVRGVARSLGLAASTTSVNLAILQQKKLVRAYYRGTKFKKYYALPETLTLMQQ